MTPEKEAAIAEVRESCTKIIGLDDFQNDKEVVFEAVKQNFGMLQYASEELRCDDEFLSEIMNFIHGSTKEMENFEEYITEYIDEIGDEDRVKEFKIFVKHLNEQSLKIVSDVLNGRIGWYKDEINELDRDDNDYDDEVSWRETDIALYTNLLSIAGEGEGIKPFKCPSCGSNEIRFYQGVPAQDTYYAYRVDPKTGGSGSEVKILPRMDRMDEVEARAFYMCHGCMKSWETWEECESQCFAAD